MSRRRTGQAIVVALVALLLVVTLFISPGFRHAHENGDESHSHARNSGSANHGAHRHSHSEHTHSHGGHTHSHSGHTHSHSGHSHSHEHRREADDAATDLASGELSESHSHIHISFLWFELTLPDWKGGDDSPTLVRPAEANAATSDVVVISSPFSMARLVHLLLLSFGPLPDITRTW
ncbi:MAG: hypothetical protein R3C20_25815 [Planctomycetaceae bacterium]